MSNRPQIPHDPLAPARRFLEEGREADAATWLEQHPSPAASALLHEIITRAATTALQQREIAAATAWLDRGRKAFPADPVLNFFRGNLHQDSEHYAEAVACYRHCVAAQPQREEFVCNLGHALIKCGQFAEACTVLASLPGSAAAQLNLGSARNRQGDSTLAIEAFESATRIRPELFSAWLNLGGARDKRGEPHAALTAYNRAVALQPGSARAHLERGHVLARLKSFRDAVSSFERCLSLSPANREAILALANARLRLCDWRGLETLRATAILPALAALDGPELLTPFFLLSLPGAATQCELRRVAETRARRIALDAVPFAPRPLARSRPLRIGYISPDFGNHAVGNCVRTLFSRHDRTRVSVHAFSLFAHDEDNFRTTIRAGCDTWDDLHALPDRAAAETIAAREIDILVDLAGHTKSNRLNLFAWRPAPIQVSWLGYPGTTGAAYIDYLLADEHLIPAEEESAFTERIVRLPGCYLPADDTYPIAPGGDDRASNGLPSAGFVFCAFNNAYKIEPLIYGAWMEILRRVPESILWLRGTDPVIEQNLRREAGARGIDPTRLVFDARSLPRAEHLARHRAASLYLDTHFYNAHSTAADALRAGLPVLTLPGRSFPSRVGLSLLSSLDLADDLAAASIDDYIARAVRLSADSAALADLRTRLLTSVAKPGGPFDTTAFARKLEDAYERLAVRP